MIKRYDVDVPPYDSAMVEYIDGSWIKVEDYIKKKIKIIEILDAIGFDDSDTQRKIEEIKKELGC
jgi:hypothetical protein